MDKTPKELGYVMPAEWEKHSALWLAWPYDEITFPGRVEKAEKVYVEIIKEIYESDPIKLLVKDESMKKKVENLLSEDSIDISKITFYITDYADVWIRDYAPLFLNKKGAVKWNYTAYGEKFPDLIKDNNVFLNLKDKIDRKIFQPDIVMEGGAVEVNGKGTVLTTEQCLLNSNRNPDLSKEDTEKYLKNYLGAKKIIWLKEGIVNDHTDGHIDDVARFVSTDTILCGYEEDEKDPNFEILRNAYEVLKNSVDQDGKPFKIIQIPMPHMNYEDGKKAPVSYVNFYIGNSVVLVPTFNDPNDGKALELIGSFFPDRKVKGVDCTDLIYGGGALHCITHEEPI